MRQWIARLILRIFGWRITGFPANPPPKYIVAVAPHTSAWDFPIGILTRWALWEDIHFIGKHTLFRPPLGWLMRALGGYPVDRRKRGNMVEAVVDIFNGKKHFAVSIAPEGTRKKVDRLKTGFYYMAKKAGVPILLCRFDWARREVGFGPLVWPGEDADADITRITDHFRGVRGKIPGYGLD